MARTPLSSGIIFRRGNYTVKALTPRLGDDTTPSPGSSPGVSTDRCLELGVKGQRIDIARLSGPLCAFEDDPTEGGSPGHVSIAPVDESGQVDQKLLEEWANCREAGGEHPLTTLLMQAVVEKNVVGPL